MDWLKLLQAHSLMTRQLRRHRSALDDSRHFPAELAVDDRPPLDKGELVTLFDDGELAAQ